MIARNAESAAVVRNAVAALRGSADRGHTCASDECVPRGYVHTNRGGARERLGRRVLPLREAPDVPGHSVWNDLPRDVRIVALGFSLRLGASANRNVAGRPQTIQRLYY
jgi:hypothetical protein